MAKSGPTPMASVINEMPFLRTPDPATNLSRATQLAGILGTAKEAATRYRAAVLAHDDLSRRLVAVFGYTGAEVWNGYVPPRTDHWRPAGVAEYNPSPLRQALVAIVTEALERQNDWRHYDADRLATVPDRHISAPWAEVRGAPQPRDPEAGLWPESEA